jgi:PAS domain S-box-containing protein
MDQLESETSPVGSFAAAILTAGQSDFVLPQLDGGAPDERDFRLLADFLPTLCWIARGDGYIVWYNKRWHDYCGSTPKAMEGWGWQSVHDPERLPDVMSRWTASIENGRPFEMVFPLRGADGVFRPFLTRIAPVRNPDGEVVRWYGVNTEITDQLKAEQALGESRGMYAVLTEAMPQMVWSTLPDGYHDFYNAQWYDFTGVPYGSTDGEAWNGMFHPDDQQRAWARWNHSLQTGEPYEIEYRLRHRSGQYRWTLGRALPVRDDHGRITRWIGTCTDIHDAKTATDRAEVLSQELSHRIKNIFSIIAGLIGLSARRHPEMKLFAKELSERVAALGRAHEFARPHSDASRPQVGSVALHGLLQRLFEPYTLNGESRIVITGADPEVDDKGATPLALLFHELATNAAKYGALSTLEGQVAVSVREHADRLTIEWREEGGPPVKQPPERQGFGSQLVSISVEQQLGGRVQREWRPEGLRVLVDLDRDSLARR